MVIKYFSAFSECIRCIQKNCCKDCGCSGSHLDGRAQNEAHLSISLVNVEACCLIFGQELFIGPHITASGSAAWLSNFLRLNKWFWSNDNWVLDLLGWVNDTGVSIIWYHLMESAILASTILLKNLSFFIAWVTNTSLFIFTWSSKC